VSEARPVPGSFRDPAGFVFERDGVLYRQVNTSFGGFDRFRSSGLMGELEDHGLLVRHEDAEPSLAAGPGAHAVLRPERIPFISYPYEWCFGQLRDAALTTLAAQSAAMARGFTLRDASAYNVQFLRGRPVLIDVLSFEPIREGRPWAAYGQFCRHFLAPLALMATRDVRLGSLLRTHLDGIPLDLAAALLPRRARMRPGVMLHLSAHARSGRRATSRGRGSGEFSDRAFQGLVESLESTIRGLEWHPPESVWTEYYERCRTYEPQAMARKEELVRKLIEEAGPETVWDLGANTGRFSRIAADSGAFTVSIDADPRVVEVSYREAVRDGATSLLPLVVDLADPSPRHGWAHRERMSLADRGPADLVMALALVHHLAIGNNVPLPSLASWLRELGRWALVEFVPKSDPQVQEMLALREDVFPGYTEDGFRAAAEERFEVVGREPIEASGRSLYLLRGRP
jgi:cyclopropane fatty-acyl-phospholipid synthase-like methyltransferase